MLRQLAIPSLVNKPPRIDGPNPRPLLLLAPCLGEEPHEHFCNADPCATSAVEHDPVFLARRAAQPGGVEKARKDDRARALNVIVEHPVARAEEREVGKSPRRGKVFELDQEVGADGREGGHEFFHEFLGLRVGLVSRCVCKEKGWAYLFIARTLTTNSEVQRVCEEGFIVRSLYRNSVSGILKSILLFTDQIDADWECRRGA
jgi:hypothetical protein